jgi:hypothetical protein
VSVATASAAAQRLTPVDAGEAARFDRVTQAAGRAGFANAMVVAHGDSTWDGWFLWHAVRGDTGILAAIFEPAMATVALERVPGTGGIGFRGVQFSPFLDYPGLIDVDVLHHPFVLETDMEFHTHHILRKVGNRVEQVCQFDGDSRSSTSKGMGTTTNVRRVEVIELLGPTPRFRVSASTSQSTDLAAPPGGATIHVEYDMPVDGRCVVR